MSQVKFIQLGTVSEPKKNYEVNGSNEYSTLLNQAIQDHPGAVIFTTFIKSATGKPKNEIYANGQLYSAGGSGSGAVYYGTDQVVNGKISNWNDSHPGEEPERGSIYIYTPNSETTGEDIANRTAYYFKCTEGQESQGKWIAFTGNVNAENVWFPNGVNRTEAWGCKEPTTNKELKTECEHNNLKQLLEYYLVQEIYPNPSTSYSSTPTISCTDGDISFGSDPATLDLLVGSSKTVTVTYTKPTNYSITNSTFIPNTTISGMTYGSSPDLDGPLDTGAISRTKDGDTYTGTLHYPAVGQATIGIGYGDNSGQYTSKDTTKAYNESETVSYTYTVPTSTLCSNRSVTFTAKGNCVDTTKLYYSWSPAGTGNYPSVGPIYYASNKKTLSSEYTITSASKQFTLPTTKTITRTTKNLTYSVYQPIYYFVDDTMKYNNKYYGNRVTLTGTVSVPLPGQLSRVYFLIPSTSTIVSLAVAGSTLSQNSQYKIVEGTVTYNGLVYNKVVFTDSAAATQDASFTLTIK